MGIRARTRVDKGVRSATGKCYNYPEEHFFTKKQFKSYYDMGNDFLINIMKEGVILYDTSYFSRYLMKGLPNVTKGAIENRLKIASEFLDPSLEWYEKFPNIVPESLGVASMHISRALLLLNGILPRSKHDVPRQLERMGEVRFSKVYKTTRKWFDSAPLEVKRESVEKALAFLKGKYDECRRELEKWP